jgi:hypothetical protein
LNDDKLSSFDFEKTLTQQGKPESLPLAPNMTGNKADCPSFVSGPQY